LLITRRVVARTAEGVVTIVLMTVNPIYEQDAE
jgi:hypothetical protein